MPKQWDNEKSGVLFRNDKKESEKHPDYRGNATINDVEYRVSAWVKTSAKGAKFMSLAFTAPDDQPQPQQRQPAQQQAWDDDSEGLPF